MTAYIDNITIVGTPEEIQEFIELRKDKYSEGVTIQGNALFSDGTYNPHIDCNGNLTFGIE